MYPQWENIAAKLYLLQLYKEAWHIDNGDYPSLLEVISKGIQHGIYDKTVYDSYSETEILELESNGYTSKRSQIYIQGIGHTQ